jgi:hypothetical protein
MVAIRLLALMFMLMIYGCREYHLFYYDDVVVNVAGGNLRVKLAPDDRKLENLNGKNIAIEGGSYGIGLYYSSNKAFDGIKISSFRLKERVSNVEYTSGSNKMREAEEFRDYVNGRMILKRIDDDGLYKAFEVFYLHDTILQYHKVDVSFRLEVFNNGLKIEDQNVSVEVDPVYKEEYHSDFIDKLMSV